MALLLMMGCCLVWQARKALLHMIMTMLYVQCFVFRQMKELCNKILLWITLRGQPGGNPSTDWNVFS